MEELVAVLSSINASLQMISGILILMLFFKDMSGKSELENIRFQLKKIQEKLGEK